MKKYIVDNPVFSDSIDIVETTDPAHADRINQAPKQIFENTLALKRQVDGNGVVIDLSGSEYDQYTWYPVTGTPIPKGGLHKIRAYTTFDLGAHPSWATNDAGYTCNMELYDKAQTWGQTDGATVCMDYSWKHTSQRPCGYIQMTHSSTPVVLLRGGGIYYIETDYATEWMVRTDVYTYEGDTVRPRNASKFEFERATIFADLDGNVDASMVTEDSTHRFVSDSEKAKWNQTDLSEKTVVFEENSSYEIASGESMETLMGKLKKLISTVKSKAPNFLSSGRVPLTDKLHTKRYIDGVGFDGTEDICHFAVCDTDFDMQVKEVQVPSFEVLQGARITLYFTDGCDLNGASFKINGRTYNTSCDLIRYIEPGEMMDFIFYDGVWQNIGGQMRELFRVKSDAMMVIEENHALAVHPEVQGPSPIPSYIGIVSEEGYTVKCLSVKEGEHYRIHSKYYDLMYCHEILVKNMDSTKFYEGDYVDVGNDLTIPEGYNYLLISLPTADKRLHIYKLP